MASQIQHGGMNQTPICIPKVLGPMIISMLFPPLYVFLHELKKNPPFQNPVSIVVNLVLTALFYFPGVIHAMSLIRNEGTWVDNYSGL